MTVAQAILESGWGKSGLTLKANNLFGIKGTYNGASVSCKTQEWDGSKYITITAAFRKYPSWAESVADHSALFLRLKRYENLRGCTDYKKACQYVREDGYATDPAYTTKLVQLIEKYGLTQYDAPGTPSTGHAGAAGTPGTSGGTNTTGGAGSPADGKGAGTEKDIDTMIEAALTEAKKQWGANENVKNYIEAPAIMGTEIITIPAGVEIPEIK